MFRRTQCARAAKLIPLFISGDLKHGRASSVSEHLGACAACRRLADEHRASREWLSQTAQAVEFEEEFYSGIRSAVLTRIVADKSTPRAPFFAPLLPRRLAFAATVAVALLAAALVYQLSRKQEERADINHPSLSSPSAQRLSSIAPSPEALPATGREPPPAGLPPQVSSPGARHPKMLAAKRRGGPQPQRLMLNARSRSEIAQQAYINTLPAVMSKPPASTRPFLDEISRIEIQTADPNIRIIWLSPKATDSSDISPVENR